MWFQSRHVKGPPHFFAQAALTEAQPVRATAIMCHQVPGSLIRFHFATPSASLALEARVGKRPFREQVFSSLQPTSNRLLRMAMVSPVNQRNPF